jgi:hypothetical protein
MIPVDVVCNLLIHLPLFLFLTLLRPKPSGYDPR